MKYKFKKGDIVRAKRALFMKFLHFPIFRSEILIVSDVNEIKYNGNDFISVGVWVHDLDGKEFHYSQANLEKI